MRDKADDSLAPPPPVVNAPFQAAPEAAKYIMRKKPHTLPPLEKFRSLEGRGSPVPQARRRSSIEEQLMQEGGQVAPADGRPLIRLTKCTDDSNPGTSAGIGQRLPPTKQGAPASATPPQLSPISNRYMPLQPIRRSSESGSCNFKP